MDDEVAERLLDKLREFVRALDEEERGLLAALVAPGVAQAYADSEVEGFGVRWTPTALPERLAQVLREGGVRVVGLDD